MKKNKIISAILVMTAVLSLTAVPSFAEPVSVLNEKSDGIQKKAGFDIGLAGSAFHLVLPPSFAPIDLSADANKVRALSEYYKNEKLGIDIGVYKYSSETNGGLEKFYQKDLLRYNGVEMELPKINGIKVKGFTALEYLNGALVISKSYCFENDGTIIQVVFMGTDSDFAWITDHIIDTLYLK